MATFHRLLSLLLLSALASVLLLSVHASASASEAASVVDEPVVDDDLSTLSASELTQLLPRDAYTDFKPVDSSVHLSSVGPRPAGAIGRSFSINGRGRIFAWYSKTPHRESDATTALIVLHGKERNAHTYFSTFNAIWHQHRGRYAAASENLIRVAPQFFSTENDKQAYNATTLAFTDSNGWQAGDPSTHPKGSGVSSFTVLDFFLDKFSDTKAYPKMNNIIFVGHGGGGQLLARYAVLGKDVRAGARAKVRYIIGDPSSALYFTKDRPVPLPAGCSESNDNWNSYRYALHNYTPGSSYPLPLGGKHVALFKRFASRDVRYVIGGADTKTGANNGDQSCMARAQGGAARTLRNQAYWRYINLLGNHPANAKVGRFHGTFPALDWKDRMHASFHGKKKENEKIPQSSAKSVALFGDTHVQHHFALIQGAGHNAKEVYGSELGGQFLFGNKKHLVNSEAPPPSSN